MIILFILFLELELSVSFQSDIEHKFINPPIVFFSPKYDLPPVDPSAVARKTLVCHSCGEQGHKSFNCPKAIQDIISKETDTKPVIDKKVITQLAF